MVNHSVVRFMVGADDLHITRPPRFSLVTNRTLYQQVSHFRERISFILVQTTLLLSGRNNTGFKVRYPNAVLMLIAILSTSTGAGKKVNSEIFTCGLEDEFARHLHQPWLEPRTGFEPVPCRLKVCHTTLYDRGRQVVVDRGIGPRTPGL
jgi:hypothetical protein